MQASLEYDARFCYHVFSYSVFIPVAWLFATLSLRLDVLVSQVRSSVWARATRMLSEIRFLSLCTHVVCSSQWNSNAYPLRTETLKRCVFSVNQSAAVQFWDAIVRLQLAHCWPNSRWGLYGTYTSVPEISFLHMFKPTNGNKNLALQQLRTPLCWIVPFQNSD